MKKKHSYRFKLCAGLLCLVFTILTSTAQEQRVIKLLPPGKTGGKPLMNALNDRQSSRDYIDKPLTDQQLSDLLWAAYGVNRSDEKKRTAPSAHNKQEIDLYVTMANGTYLFDALNHSLIEINSTDIRSKTGKQGFTGTAAVNLIYVLDKKKAASDDANESIAWGSITAGAIVQNVYLYCASENLGCVVRGWVDKDLMADELKLNENQLVLLAQTVGYIK